MSTRAFAYRFFHRQQAANRAENGLSPAQMCVNIIIILLILNIENTIKIGKDMDTLFFLHLFNSLLMIAMPLALAIALTWRWKLGWRLWFLGGATFILSQVGHIPFNGLMTVLLAHTPLVGLQPEQARIFNALFLGLSAGLFEELARYAVLRWWLKDARSWRKAVLVGAGHGGMEALILGGLALFAFFQLVSMRGADLSSLVPPQQLALAQQQVSDYWSMPWSTALLGAVERLFTMLVQISLSLLVMQAFIRKQAAWVGLAVFYHALVDASAVLALPALGIYGTEALVGGYAVLSAVLILTLYRPEPPEKTESGQAPPAVILPPAPLEETPQDLDNSRFI